LGIAPICSSVPSAFSRETQNEDLSLREGWGRDYRKGEGKEVGREGKEGGRGRKGGRRGERGREGREGGGREGEGGREGRLSIIS